MDIKLTFLVALFLAMPVVLYQVWAFVAPGLYMKEKRFAFPLLATSILLFFVGMEVSPHKLMQGWRVAIFGTLLERALDPVGKERHRTECGDGDQHRGEQQAQAGFAQRRPPVHRERAGGAHSFTSRPASRRSTRSQRAASC